MRVGIPREVHPGERRVAGTPDTVTKLKKQGFEVIVQRGAGELAQFPDAAYEAAGAVLSEGPEGAWDAEIVVKLNPPTLDEVRLLREGGTLISLIYAGQNPALVDALAARKATVVALDGMPRTTVAQKMDVISSQANIAGYRAVIEASTTYGGFFSGQITAAGSTRPAKVLIIGAGVAGLAAIAAARGLGAEVRAFDTRAAARLDVESLGGRFLEVDFKEEGEGQGGYAKLMSPAFIEAEMKLFRQQAREVDIIITTALVPGRKAPLLVPEDIVAVMKPGSVIVDMAAIQGGNCACTVPGEVAVVHGVRIVGYTDLASRLPTHASQFFGSNLVHLLKHMGGAAGFKLDMDDENVRGAFLLQQGERVPVVPLKAPKALPTAKETTAPVPVAPKRSLGEGIGLMVALVGLATLGLYAPAEFLQHFTVFVLACFVGWQVVWNVTPALHTPLMSVTNAVSGIIIVGGMLQLGPEPTRPSALLGAAAVLLASINIAGGFFVTQRMLRMFHKGAGSKHA